MAENGNGNGNGLTVKVIGGIVSLALTVAGALLLGQMSDLRNELHNVATMQQSRGERITAAEAKAANNSSRLDRLEAVMDKQVQSNSLKIETLEERLRKMEQGKGRDR